MAITINYTKRIIRVEKADLTLVLKSAPFEIYELDVNDFRLELKDIEDSVQGMPFVDTHFHSTAVTAEGETVLRVFEIINGYTVTFEDGMYAVNIVGASNNISDVTNVNQVQVRNSKFAGLAQPSTTK